MTTVYIIRHAEAMGNVLETFQGHSDCEISPKGRKQLEFIKERFKDIEYNAIYSSPLIRTMETAKAVNYYHSLPIIADKGLIEINGGVFEGEKWSELPKLFPKSYNLWKHDSPNFTVENGESMKEVYLRITNTVKRLANDNKDKTVAVISHGCAIKNLLAYANGWGNEGILKLGWSDNTAVSKIIFDDNMCPSVEFENDSSHLPENYSTLSSQVWWRDEEVKIR